MAGATSERAQPVLQTPRQPGSSPLQGPRVHGPTAELGGSRPSLPVVFWEPVFASARGRCSVHAEWFSRAPERLDGAHGWEGL